MAFRHVPRHASRRAPRQADQPLHWHWHWRRRWRAFARVGIAAVVAVLLAAPPLHADQAEAVDEGEAHRERQQRLEEAVDQLTAEARDLDRIGDDHESPVFSRPHPTMRDWDGEMALVALERMQRRFTGNPYRDTYIRYHLLWSAKQVMEQQLHRYLETGEHELPRRTTQLLRSLLRDMPEPIEWERRPERRYEPEEKRREYLNVRNSMRREVRVQVGYPPFDRTYYGRSALPHVPEGRRAELERVVDEAEAQMAELRAAYRVVIDPVARAYNRRVSRLNLMMRQYRGELVYTLIQTGDQETFERALHAIDEQQRQRQWTAIDLMRYLYLAAMDGYLLLYDESTYQAAARHLQRIGQRSDEYREYLFGDRSPPRQYSPRRRNLADYAFHIRHLLDDPGSIRWFQQQVELSRVDVEMHRDADFTFTPYNFTMADVRAARERATLEIYHPRGDDGHRRGLIPTYDLADSRMERLVDIGTTERVPERIQLIHEYGNHALINWALLASGESYQDPRLFRRINWVLSSDAPFTYDRGMRLQMLAQMPAERWRPWIDRDLRWLRNALTDNGNWGYSHYGGDATGWGDHANGAYGVLGLWAAQRAGVDIPLSVWRDVDTHWRVTQQRTPRDQPAGWALGMFNVTEESDDDSVRDTFRQRVTGPMTAAGTFTLMLSQRYLGDSDRSAQRHLQKGLDWLDDNFTLESDDPGVDWFYYMWMMQRVGEATGYRTFNGIDWFRDVTAEILNRQQSNGLWEDPGGRQSQLVSTGFALLYLSNSYDPIGISKIRFDGDWNRRPHDLLNFVEYASDQYQVRTGWQIVTLDAPLFQLIESPLLYLSTDARFDLRDEHVDRLREYIEAGGMLVLNPDRATAGVARSIQELAEELFPQYELVDVPSDHMLFRIHQQLRPNLRMRMVHNGVRPLIVQFVTDIGGDLQDNRIGRSDAFAALSNLYLHSVGRNPRRLRLETNHIVPDADAEITRSVRVARLAHGGADDPEPAALPQLAALLQNEHGVELIHDTIDPAALSDQRLAVMTAGGDAQLTDEQAQAIRQWIENGGTLWLDAVGGGREAVANARELLRKIEPERDLRRLSSSSPIITGRGLGAAGDGDSDDAHDNRRVQFRHFALREMGPVTTPRLEAIEIDGRPAIVFSPEDLTAGLAGLEHWGIFGYSVDSARRLLANAVLHAAE